MNNSIFFVTLCVLIIGLIAVLSQAGIGPFGAPGSFWAVVAIADAIGLIGYLWGRDA